MLRVAIAGGNIGASALISLLKGDTNTELIGIYDKKTDSPGSILAKKWNIPVFDDIQTLCSASPEIVINVTGNYEISNEIRKTSSYKIEVIEGTGARLLWEIIEKQKRANLEVFKTIENQKTFFSITEKIGISPPLSDFFSFILDRAIDITDTPAGSIVLLKDDGLNLIASKGLSKRFIESTSGKIIQGGLADTVIKTKEIFAVTDTTKTEYTKNNPALISEKIRSVLACPIVLRGNVIGILYLDDFKPRQYSDRQKISIKLITGLLSIFIDKLNIQEKLAELENKELLFLENSFDIVLLTDSAGYIYAASEIAERILGYSKNYLKGKAIQSLIKANYWEQILNKLSSDNIVKEFDSGLFISGGAEIPVKINAATLKKTNGGGVDWLFVIHSLKNEEDLKEIILEKEKAIELVKEEFEKKVLERTGELERINRDLDYANQLKGRFISNMSHELRTPLNSILGFSEVLLDRTFGDLSEHQERYLKNIHNSGKHLLELVNNILDIAKIEAGKYEMVYETIPVDDLLNEVINVMKPLAESKFIELMVSVGEGVNQITADRVKLKQILYNLLSNAIKFTPEGGMVRVDVSGEGRTDLDYSDNGFGFQGIKFSVQDTGIGISPEDREKIFNEFEQATSTFSKKYGGVGLGLALTKKLVELHGGTISVESNLGEGSTFSFYIPMTTPLPAESEKIKNEAIILNTPWAKEEAPLILVVEDDLSTAELLTLNLTQAGYRVAHAFNGDEAIEKARDLKPFAITLDVLLPKKDGWEVLQALKSNRETSDIPVIIHSIVDNKELAFALGATDYLLKPLEREALISKLEEITISKGKKVLPVSVLIVESDDKVTKSLKDPLEQYGFLIYTATTGRRGIELASALRPAVILLDFKLPDMIGYDVIKEIKEGPSTKDIPVFILTEKDISVEDRIAYVGKIERIVQKNAFNIKELIGHIKELEILYPKRAGLIDELTGVFSHRYFQIRLAQEVERSTRYKIPLNLLLLDLDGFSQYSKQYGEYYANITLKKVAELIRKNIRGSDVVVRYGGDSFAIILPNTVVSAALSMSNRFNAIIKNYPFIFENSQPKGHITASIGLTFLDGQSTEEFILCAEKALAKAFTKGGDRVEVYSREQYEEEEVEKY
ncbi:MAG: diguanylate cyclase [Nitrospirae bacterium]|jgi:diguanylate cyclase (GGDEF)-like protein/PAS domain S-box-containing protein|nr:diguanylate cyclase [Nitrospirota bacterium]